MFDTGPFSIEEDAIYYQERAADYAAFAVSANDAELTERFQQASAYYSAMAREALFRLLSPTPARPRLGPGDLDRGH